VTAARTCPAGLADVVTRPNWCAWVAFYGCGGSSGWNDAPDVAERHETFSAPICALDCYDRPMHHTTAFLLTIPLGALLLGCGNDDDSSTSTSPTITTTTSGGTTYDNPTEFYANFAEPCPIDDFDVCKEGLDCDRGCNGIGQIGVCTTKNCQSDGDCATIDGHTQVCQPQAWDASPDAVYKNCVWLCTDDSECPTSVDAVLVCNGGRCLPACLEDP
jgi:hypothetical protein